MSDSQTLMIERRERRRYPVVQSPARAQRLRRPAGRGDDAAMAELSADDSVLAIVVRGEGRAFSAGFDLKAGAANGRSAHAR